MARGPDRHIDLTVTVSGQDAPVRVNAQQKTNQIIREALRLSGNQSQPIEDWELHRQDMRLVALGITVVEAKLVDGMVLSLGPKSGEGG
jgi:hypothetical protein